MTNSAHLCGGRTAATAETAGCTAGPVANPTGRPEGGGCLFRNDNDGRVYPVQIQEVKDAYESEAAYWAAVDRMKRRIRDVQAPHYYENPDLSSSAEQ